MIEYQQSKAMLAVGQFGCNVKLRFEPIKFSNSYFKAVGCLFLLFACDCLSLDLFARTGELMIK